MRTRARPSLRHQLLLGILLPVLLFVAFNTAVLYHQMLQAADTAYDRTLLATAKAIGEQLELEGSGDQARLSGKLSYAALEAFEADNRSRLFYLVTGFSGEMVAGFPGLRPWRGRLPDRGPYAALVHFYDDEYQGLPVRVAVLLQPVSGANQQGMATIQVAETLDLRETLARQILIDTLWRQAGLVLVIAAVVVVVVHRVTQPVRSLSAELAGRTENDLRPIDAARAPHEIAPLIESANLHMARLSQLLEHQKRFVRDSSHQLRTPLAVLKTQVQSALRGDVEPRLALEEIAQTVEGATELANQMLALAKVEQLRQQDDVPVSDWTQTVRQVALDLSALIADKALDFELEAGEARVRAHEWSLRELTLRMNSAGCAAQDAKRSGIGSLITSDRSRPRPALSSSVACSHCSQSRVCAMPSRPRSTGPWLGTSVLIPCVFTSCSIRSRLSSQRARSACGVVGTRSANTRPPANSTPLSWSISTRSSAVWPDRRSSSMRWPPSCQLPGSIACVAGRCSLPFIQSPQRRNRLSS